MTKPSKGTNASPRPAPRSRAKPSARPRKSQELSGSCQTWYIGVDEAGYGPSLGPLVVAATAFKGDDALSANDWWDALPSFFSRKEEAGRLVIDDSKRILAGGNGQRLLRRSVEQILRLAGASPRTLQELILHLAPTDVDSLYAEHWYDPDEPSAHASEDAPGAEESLASTAELSEIEIDSAILQVKRPTARVVFPSAFNRHLEWSPNKADVELAVIADLLRTQLDAVDSSCHQVVITVDRLGGRRYYRDLVEDLARTAFVMTVEESRARSVYRYTTASYDVEIHFVVEGDSKHLPIAAASMIAKCVRERCMRDFNDFWQRNATSLAPTAGYQPDAKRFMKDVGPHLKRLGISLDEFWRKR